MSTRNEGAWFPACTPGVQALDEGISPVSIPGLGGGPPTAVGQVSGQVSVLSLDVLQTLCCLEMLSALPASMAHAAGSTLDRRHG